MELRIAKETPTSIEKTRFVWADHELITLDQDGTVMIAHRPKDGFKISA